MPESVKVAPMAIWLNWVCIKALLGEAWVNQTDGIIAVGYIRYNKIIYTSFGGCIRDAFWMGHQIMTNCYKRHGELGELGKFGNPIAFARAHVSYSDKQSVLLRN